MSVYNSLLAGVLTLLAFLLGLLIRMVSGGADVPLVNFARAAVVKVAERCVVKFSESRVREAHLHHKYFLAVKDVWIVDEIGFAGLELKPVPIWLLWIDHVSANGLYDALANIIRFDDSLNRIVVHGGFGYGPDLVRWPNIEGWRSTGVSILNPKFERLSLLWSFFKSSTHWRNPRPRTSDQRFPRQFV